MKFSIRTMMILVTLFAVGVLCYHEIDWITPEKTTIRIQNDSWNVVGRAANAVAIVDVEENFSVPVRYAHVQFYAGTIPFDQKIHLPVKVYGGSGVFEFDFISRKTMSDISITFYDEKSALLGRANVSADSISWDGLTFD